MKVTDPGEDDGPAGEGLALRALRFGDRARMLELARDPDQLVLGTPAFVRRPEGLGDLDERVARSRAAHDAGEPGDLAAVDVLDPDRFLGSFSWRLGAHPLMRVADVGYAVHPDARGRGVASRALRVLTHWLLLDPDGPAMARVQLDHSVENPASCRVALAAGMEREGVRRSFLPLRDPRAASGVRRHDVCLHGVLPEDLAGP